MFSGVIIGLIAAVSSATWLYTVFMRRSGGNTKNSLIVAAVLGFIVFFMVWSVSTMIDAALE